MLLRLVFVFFLINFPSTTSIVSSPLAKRELPKRVIVGYAKTCSDNVIESVRNGINVLIWYFIHFEAKSDHDNNLYPVVMGNPTGENLEVINACIHKLDGLGYDDIVHLVSFGGWNGRHLDTRFTAVELYESWKSWDGGSVFHGIDWDLEGHDNLNSPRNVFSIECLERMGEMSELAKQDGYLVSITPAESYLDFSTEKFSRYVNLSYPNDDWHQDFLYHGSNVYAYILAKYEKSIDMISIQLYESYTHAAYNITQLGMNPVKYLTNYISSLVKEEYGDKHGYMVHFDDELIDFKRQFVHVPLNKLVIGLANGWALNSNKHYFFNPQHVGEAYKWLRQNKLVIRGFMFWCVELEGENSVYLTPGLNQFMKIRQVSNDALL